jgi:hypothetical protein
VPAGTWHFVLDCIVIAGVDVTFDLLHRRAGADTVVATWTQHFDPLPTGFDAQAYEIDQPGAAIEFVAGDRLVFRFTGANTIQSDSWIPNGDGVHSKGRIPNLTLPQ